MESLTEPDDAEEAQEMKEVIQENEETMQVLRYFTFDSQLVDYQLIWDQLVQKSTGRAYSFTETRLESENGIRSNQFPLWPYGEPSDHHRNYDLRC